MQRLDGRLQRVDRIKERLDRLTFGPEGRIGAAEVIADELLQIAVVKLIGEFLPGREVQLRLVQSTAEALAILGDEPREQSSGNHATDQQQAIQQAADDSHRHPQACVTGAV